MNKIRIQYCEMNIFLDSYSDVGDIMTICDVDDFEIDIALVAELISSVKIPLIFQNHVISEMP